MAEAGSLPSGSNGWSYGQWGTLSKLLTFGPVPLPLEQLEEGQVVVKVCAAGLNPVDYKIAGGMNKSRPLPIVPGLDVSGIIVAVGKGVDRLHVGDEVYGSVGGIQFGTLEEYVISKEVQLAKKPAALSHEEAAALPVAILTALGAFRKVGLEENKRVFITGGAGGVGVHAIQLAKTFFKAAEVVTTGSLHKVELLLGLGADKVVDYRSKYEEELSGFDAAMDCVGGGESLRALKVVNPGTTVVTIADWGVSDPAVVTYALASRGEDLELLEPLLSSGAIKAVLDKAFNFQEVPEAFAYLETGRATGKVVVTVSK